MITLSDFVYESNKANTPQELTDCLVEFLKQFGVSRFTMAEITSRSTSEKESRFGLLVNYPEEWLERYYDLHYVEVDPVYRKAYTATKPFTWEEIRKEYPSKTASRVMNEAEEFGLRGGVSLTIKQPKGKTIGFSYVSSEQDMRCDKDARSILSLVSFQCCQVYSDLVKKNDPEEPPVAILTEREREVLQWIASGKSKTETADILSVSESCVKRHCESVFRKLDTNTLAYAVARAYKQGLIDF